MRAKTNPAAIKAWSANALLAAGLAASAMAACQSSPSSGGPVDAAKAGAGGGAGQGAAGAAVEPPDAPIDCTDTEQNLPADVFCIGLYEHHDTNRHPSDVHPYTPGNTFWSDGAQKQRYFYLPPGTQIDSSDIDAWK